MNIEIINGNNLSFVRINNKAFIVKKSKRANKKYDVYDLYDNYILSFGDKRYQQYYDKFEQYKSKNHNDNKRLQNYKKRAEGIGNLDDLDSPNFWSYNFLW
jgi:hypothetical protein